MTMTEPIPTAADRRRWRAALAARAAEAARHATDPLERARLEGVAEALGAEASVAGRTSSAGLVLVAKVKATKLGRLGLGAFEVWSDPHTGERWERRRTADGGEEWRSDRLVSESDEPTAQVEPIGVRRRGQRWPGVSAFAPAEKPAKAEELDPYADFEPHERPVAEKLARLLGGRR